MRRLFAWLMALSLAGFGSAALAGRPIGHPPAPQRHALYFNGDRPEAAVLDRLAGRWHGSAISLEIKGSKLRIRGDSELAGRYRLFAHQGATYAISRRSADPDRRREGRPALSTERAICHVVVRVDTAPDGSLSATPVADETKTTCPMGYLAGLSRSERRALIFADAPDSTQTLQRMN